LKIKLKNNQAINLSNPFGNVTGLLGKIINIYKSNYDKLVDCPYCGGTGKTQQDTYSDAWCLVCACRGNLKIGDLKKYHCSTLMPLVPKDSVKDYIPRDSNHIKVGDEVLVTHPFLPHIKCVAKCARSTYSVYSYNNEDYCYYSTVTWAHSMLLLSSKSRTERLYEAMNKLNGKQALEATIKYRNYKE
jgi:hypothetical protein